MSRPAPGVLWCLQEKWHRVHDTWSHMGFLQLLHSSRASPAQDSFSGQLVTLYVCLELGGQGCAHTLFSVFTRHSSPGAYSARHPEDCKLVVQSTRQPCWGAVSPSWGDSVSQVDKQQDSQAHSQESKGHS